MRIEHVVQLLTVVGIRLWNARSSIELLIETSWSTVYPIRIADSKRPTRASCDRMSSIYFGTGKRVPRVNASWEASVGSDFTISRVWQTDVGLVQLIRLVITFSRNNIRRARPFRVVMIPRFDRLSNFFFFLYILLDFDRFFEKKNRCFIVLNCDNQL